MVNNMVGLSNMETRLDSCAFCRQPAVTNCDKSHKAICIDCLTVVPVSVNISESLIQVVAKKHAPKRHLAKLERIALERGE